MPPSGRVSTPSATIRLSSFTKSSTRPASATSTWSVRHCQPDERKGAASARGVVQVRPICWFRTTALSAQSSSSAVQNPKGAASTSAASGGRAPSAQPEVAIRDRGHVAPHIADVKRIVRVRNEGELTRRGRLPTFKTVSGRRGWFRPHPVPLQIEAKMASKGHTRRVEWVDADVLMTDATGVAVAVPGTARLAGRFSAAVALKSGSRGRRAGMLVGTVFVGRATARAAVAEAFVPDVTIHGGCTDDLPIRVGADGTLGTSATHSEESCEKNGSREPQASSPCSPTRPA